MIYPTHALPLAHQARVLQLSRSSLYYKPVAVSDRDLRSIKSIDCFHTEYPFAGARMLRDMLRGNGYAEISRRHVARLMRLMRIEALYRREQSTKRNRAHPVFPYLLRGRTIDRPNEVWCAYITYISMRHGFLYLFIILDWATRRAIEWRLSNTLASDFCIDAVESAVTKYGRPEIFNTNQGSQFTDHRFVQTLQSNGIAISMDGKGA